MPLKFPQNFHTKFPHKISTTANCHVCNCTRLPFLLWVGSLVPRLVCDLHMHWMGCMTTGLTTPLMGTYKLVWIILFCQTKLCMHLLALFPGSPLPLHHCGNENMEGEKTGSLRPLRIFHCRTRGGGGGGGGNLGTRLCTCPERRLPGCSLASFPSLRPDFIPQPWPEVNSADRDRTKPKLATFTVPSTT